MSSDTEKPRIMIVDDQTENIHMLMAVLKDEYAVTPSLNGKAAIEKAKKGTPAGSDPARYPDAGY